MKFSKAKANPHPPNTKWPNAKKPNTKQIDIAIPTFGYKDHISIDQGRGFIRKWEVTDASRYDGYELENLIDPDKMVSDVWRFQCLGPPMFGKHGLRFKGEPQNAGTAWIETPHSYPQAERGAHE